MRMIEAIKTEIIPALTCIFNQSLNTGIFPEKLKIERVIERYIKLSFNLTLSIEGNQFMFKELSTYLY